MKAIGVLATVLVAAGAAVAAVAGVRSLPDIKRYLKIRQM
ncbi:MAG: DUF6893 family small protein [Nocardioidaceae bacterium]